MKDMSRFREPTAADDLQPCAWCHTLLLPEELDKRGMCYGECSEFDSEDEEEKSIALEKKVRKR